MRIFSIFCFAVIVFAFATPSFADGHRYGFDRAHTQILFFADHLGFSKSQGEFLDFGGHFNFDPENPEKGEVEVSIKTESIDMDHEKWNSHMKNADFFDVENHPEMTFKSTEIEVLSRNTANIKGNLTLLGITKPVVLKTKFNKADVHPFSGKFVAGFSASTTIRRSMFGMNYGLPLLGDKIEVRIEVEGVRGEALAN